MHVMVFRREVPKKTRMTAPDVKPNTDELDIKKCAAHFETCGWDSLEFDPRFSSSHPGLPFPPCLGLPLQPTLSSALRVCPSSRL